MVAFYRGEEADIEQKKALNGLVEFSGHAIAKSQIEYVDLSGGPIGNAIDRAALVEEAVEADDFISDRVTYPAYWLDVFNDDHNFIKTHEPDFKNMEGRRMVAGAHALLYFSLAVGALYAQHVSEGDQWAGDVANLMNPLIAI